MSDPAMSDAPMSDPGLPPASRPSVRRAARASSRSARSRSPSAASRSRRPRPTPASTRPTISPNAASAPTTTVDDDRAAVDSCREANPASPAAADDATFDTVNLPDGTTQTFAAGAAGTVTIGRTGATLTVVAVGTNPGWVTDIEQASGAEVEVEFRNGTTRIDLEAEFEDGAVRVPRTRAR